MVPDDRQPTDPVLFHDWEDAVDVGVRVDRDGLALFEYARVVVKLSGAAFAGPAAAGTDPVCLGQMADEVASVHDLGVQIAVVVGGGKEADRPGTATSAVRTGPMSASVESSKAPVP